MLGTSGAVFPSDSRLSISSGTTGLVQLSGKSICFLCNANITSSLNLFRVTGELDNNFRTCKGSTISDRLQVFDGSGTIDLSNVAVGNWLNFRNRSGAVRLVNTSANFLDIGEMRNGAIVLDAITVRTRSFLADNDGDVSISGSSCGRIFLLRNKKTTTATGNNGFQALQVQENQGAVVYENNNGDLALLSDNVGGVNVFFNTLDRLVFRDNVPPPIVGDNTVGRPEGQCAVSA